MIRKIFCTEIVDFFGTIWFANMENKREILIDRIVCISEMWIDYEEKIPPAFLNNYSIIQSHVIRNSNIGGVIIFHKYNSSQITILEKDTH